MKKTFKLLSFCMVLALVLSIFTLQVSAATVSITGGNYEVGQTFSVKVQFNADDVLRVVDATVTYDSKIVKLNSVSGADYNVSGNEIKIYDEAFDPAKNTNKSSYTLNFTAIATGNCTISADVVGGGFADSYAKSSTTVVVTAPKPSSNANLASIKLSNGSLSPAFDANTTNYNVTVKYGVESIDITAAVADGKSTYTGGGTFDLKVGDNERILTVTAQDGTKKTYIINVKRMTEAETLAAEEDERNSNPLLVTIDGVDYTIVNELDDSLVPTGFNKETATRKEQEITVLNEVNGKYQLCYLVDNNGENGAFYNRDENDNFTKLSYINVNKTMYIIENFDIDGVLPVNYKYTKFTIDGTEIEAITYVDEALADFYVFNCYVPGSEQASYYKYDKTEGTMQRAADFAVALQSAQNLPTDTQPQNTGKLAWFKNLNTTGKAVLLLVIFIGIVLIVATILVIVKLASGSDDEQDDDENYGVDENDEFILTDFSQGDNKNE